MILILKLFAGHLIGDFILQNTKISKLRLKKTKYLKQHIFTIFMTLIICTIDFFSFRLLLCIACISMIHVFDLLKKYFPDTIQVLIINQTIHVITIILFPTLFGLISENYLFLIVQKFYSNGHIWVYICGYIFGIFGGSVIVSTLLKRFSSYGSEFHVGEAIGKIERFILITLALLNEYTTIGIIFAVKGVARRIYVEKDEKNGELYFIGTILSFSLALATAISINTVNSYIK